VAAKRKSSLDNAVVCKDLPTKHAHISLSPSIAGEELTPEMVQWMKDVDLQSPAILYSSQESSAVSGNQTDLWAAKQFQLAPGGKLFVRS